MGISVGRFCHEWYSGQFPVGISVMRDYVAISACLSVRNVLVTVFIKLGLVDNSF